MTLTVQILGQPGRDNAALVTIDSGQRVDRLLFDCGADCLSSLAVSEIQAVDHLLFSHFHMDHISGFDTFFRMTYDRTVRPNHIWGPPATSQVMSHRFQGYLWNLYQHLESVWDTHDIHPDRVDVTRFVGREAFAQAHPLSSTTRTPLLIDTPEYSVEAYTMNHQTPSMAYIVREKPRSNVDTSKLGALGFKPGAWLKQIKDPQADGSVVVEVNGQSHTLADLRAQLITETPGQSVAYLTDFLMDEAAQSVLIPALQGCTTMICETQYRAEDHELAVRNYHMTTAIVAETARRAQVQNLILFHLSDRYDKAAWRELLHEAQAIFPNTRLPETWTF